MSKQPFKVATIIDENGKFEIRRSYYKDKPRDPITGIKSNKVTIRHFRYNTADKFDMYNTWDENLKDIMEDIGKQKSFIIDCDSEDGGTMKIKSWNDIKPWVNYTGVYQLEGERPVQIGY